MAAALAASARQPVRSGRLWGAAEALHEAIGAVPSPVERSFYAPYTAVAIAGLSEAAWEATLVEGRTMTTGEAVEFALGTPQARGEPASTSPSRLADLSAREADVLALVAKGMTNLQIAKELYISPRTVDAHLRSVYKKIGASTRAEATRSALDHGLLT